MITLNFPAPAPLLSLNDRGHWAQKARHVALWRHASNVAAMAAERHGLRRRQPRSVVRLTLPVRSVKQRRDPHNYTPTTKAVVDGLVDAGLWPDDTSEYVVTLEPDFRQGGDVTVSIWSTDEWAQGVTL